MFRTGALAKLPLLAAFFFFFFFFFFFSRHLPAVMEHVFFPTGLTAAEVTLRPLFKTWDGLVSGRIHSGMVSVSYGRFNLSDVVLGR